MDEEVRLATITVTVSPPVDPSDRPAVEELLRAVAETESAQAWPAIATKHLRTVFNLVDQAQLRVLVRRFEARTRQNLKGSPDFSQLQVGLSTIGSDISLNSPVQTLANRIADNVLL